LPGFPRMLVGYKGLILREFSLILTAVKAGIRSSGHRWRRFKSRRPDRMMPAMSAQDPKVTQPPIQPDQQPIQRTVGKRVPLPPGVLPSPEARAAMTANARYITRAPKGIFFYKNHEEMIRDRERWTIDAVIARQTERG
jgi:hypothetical protein